VVPPESFFPRSEVRTGVQVAANPSNGVAEVIGSGVHGTANEVRSRKFRGSSIMNRATTSAAEKFAAAVVVVLKIVC